MKKTDRTSLAIFFVVVIIGFLVALAGSQNGSLIAGLPLFGASVALAFLVQWLVFIPSYWFQTEKFFDLTGSLTYISVTIIAVLFSPVIDNRSLLLAGLVAIWAIRLGAFLFAAFKSRQR